MRAALQAAAAPFCVTPADALDTAAALRDLAATIDLAARDAQHKAMFRAAGSSWVPTCRVDAREAMGHRHCHTVLLALQVPCLDRPTATVSYVWEPDTSVDPMVTVNMYPEGNHDFPGAAALALVTDDDDMGSNTRWQDDGGVLDTLTSRGLWDLAVDLAAVVAAWPTVAAKVPALGRLPPGWRRGPHGCPT